MLPRAILLDLDDTILDDSGRNDESWADACLFAQESCPDIDPEAVQQAIREHAKWWWADVERNRRGRLDLYPATREIVCGVFEKLGHDQAVGIALADRYRDLRTERERVHEGAIETLDWLREKGVLLGLMTNGGAQPQRAKVERFGLAPYFHHIVIEGEFGCGKPDPRVFRSLLDALAVAPNQTWAVGDNLHADVFGAMEHGITGIWLDRHGSGVPEDAARQPDRILRALSDLRV